MFEVSALCMCVEALVCSQSLNLLEELIISSTSVSRHVEKNGVVKKYYGYKEEGWTGSCAQQCKTNSKAEEGIVH